MKFFDERSEIKTIDEGAALAISQGLLESEDVRWAARRRMAVWSFRVLVLLTFAILGYAFLAPDGVMTANALLGIITFMYGTFMSIIAGYFGVDWRANKKANKDKAETP